MATFFLLNHSICVTIIFKKQILITFNRDPLNLFGEPLCDDVMTSAPAAAHGLARRRTLTPRWCASLRPAPRLGQAPLKGRSTAGRGGRGAAC